MIETKEINGLRVGDPCKVLTARLGYALGVVTGFDADFIIRVAPRAGGVSLPYHVSRVKYCARGEDKRSPRI